MDYQYLNECVVTLIRIVVLNKLLTGEHRKYVTAVESRERSQRDLSYHYLRLIALVTMNSWQAEVCLSVPDSPLLVLIHSDFC